jgi:hypothetical protein
MRCALSQKRADAARFTRGKFFHRTTHGLATGAGFIILIFVREIKRRLQFNKSNPSWFQPQVSPENSEL